MILTSLLIAAAAALPQGAEPVRINPAHFTTKIDNPYFPMRPGSRWQFRETDTQGHAQKVVITVTHRTKRIANGVTARVVRDVGSEHGVPVEVTEDWFAQDRAGNIWYFGEDTTAYRDGKPHSTAGSFEAGVDGAQGGVAMPADPRPGLRYRQEQYAGHAEDRGQVLSTHEQAEVPFGHFDHVLLTRDFTPLEPRVLEYKLYARGVGPVLVLGVSGGGATERLIRFSR